MEERQERVSPTMVTARTTFAVIFLVTSILFVSQVPSLVHSLQLIHSTRQLPLITVTAPIPSTSRKKTMEPTSTVRWRRRNAHATSLQSTTTMSKSNPENDGNQTTIITETMSSENQSSAEDSAATSDGDSWWKDARKRSVFGILSSSFLNLLGFTMVAGPLTPALGSHFGLEIGSLFGTLTSAYPLGMLIGVFLWPSLSDKVGRRPILAFSLFGSGLGLMAQSLVIRRGGSLSNFLLARALTGIFAGSSPVSKAYLADIGAKDGKLPRYLALKDAASTMAFILGPAAGGLLFDIRRKMIQGGKDLSRTELLKTSGSLSFVIAVSSAASILAALLAGTLVREDASSLRRVRPNLQKDEQNFKQQQQQHYQNYATTSIEREEDLVSCPLGRRLWAGVASVCAVSFLFNVGDSTFHAFSSAFLRNHGISTRDLGLLFTSLACISFGVSSTTASVILAHFGPVLTCAIGLSMIGSGLLLFGLIASGVIPVSFIISAAAAAIYFCGVPIYGPTIPTMLLRCVPAHRRGFVLGLDGLTNTMARILSPLLMGEIYRRYDAGTAFVTAGAATLLGASIALFRRYTTMRKETNTS